MVPRELWNTLGAAGLLCPDVDEAYGGAGTTPHVTLAMIEELSRMGLVASRLATVFTPILWRPISADTALRHKSALAPRMVTGEVVGALAMTEPGAGSNVQGIRTTRFATVTSGCLTALRSLSPTASTLTSSSLQRLPIPAKVLRVHLIPVDAHAPGFEKSKKIDKIGQHASDTALLFFTDVRLPADALLGEENKGFAILMDELHVSVSVLLRRQLRHRKVRWTSPLTT